LRYIFSNDVLETLLIIGKWAGQGAKKRGHMKKTFLFLIGYVVFLCIGCSSGGGLEAIDYSSQKSWLAMPGMASVATAVPLKTGLSSLEDSATVDVFYIHPTTCQSTNVLNCGIDDVNNVSEFVMIEQASTFNAVGRIYAPK